MRPRHSGYACADTGSIRPGAMHKPVLLTFLVLASAMIVSPQSGRKITNARPMTSAPIQPPLTPDSEPPSLPSTSAALLFVPESLREREILALDKGSFRLADFSGKVLVINLWASWCGPCRREVPEYEKVRKVFVGREVEFIGLTTEDPRAALDRVNRFLRDISFGFRLGWADRDLARTLMNGKAAIPQTIVIDSAGHIVNHWVGYAPGRSGDRLKDAIDNALKDLH